MNESTKFWFANYTFKPFAHRPIEIPGENATVSDLEKAIDMAYEVRDDFFRYHRMQGFVIEPSTHPFALNVVAELSQRIADLECPGYQDYVEYKETELNGYKLLPPEMCRISYSLFKELNKLWGMSRMRMKRFRDTFNNKACSDWNKIGTDGESFGGMHWKEAKKSEDYSKAGDLTRKANLDALCSLPYPKRVILRLVEIGCSNRRESVPFINSICHMMTLLRAKFLHSKSGNTSPDTINM